MCANEMALDGSRVAHQYSWLPAMVALRESQQDYSGLDPSEVEPALGVVIWKKICHAKSNSPRSPFRPAKTMA